MIFAFGFRKSNNTAKGSVSFARAVSLEWGAGALEGRALAAELEMTLDRVAKARHSMLQIEPMVAALCPRTHLSATPTLAS